MIKRKGIFMNNENVNNGVVDEEFCLMVRGLVELFLRGETNLVIHGSFHFHQGFTLIIPDESYEGEEWCGRSLDLNLNLHSGNVKGIISIGQWIQFMTLKSCGDFKYAKRIVDILEEICNKNPQKYSAILEEINWAKNLPSLQKQLVPRSYVLRDICCSEKIKNFFEKNQIDWASFNHGEYIIYEVSEEDLEKLRKEFSNGLTTHFTLNPIPPRNDEILKLLRIFES